MNLFNLTILLLGLVVLLAIQLGIFFLISVLGGWRELANRYRASQPFKGQTIGWQSGRMRKTVRDRTCLTFGVDSKGLFISMARCSARLIRLCTSRGPKSPRPEDAGDSSTACTCDSPTFRGSGFSSGADWPRSSPQRTAPDRLNLNRGWCMVRA